MADQNLTVRITGDTSDLDAATKKAASDLASLKGDVDRLGATSADVKIDTNAETAQADLADVQASAERLAAESVDIPVGLELDRLNRDYANLQRVLARIEAQKANPDVGLNITTLLRDEARVMAAMDKIDARRAEITVTADTSQATASLDRLSNAMGYLPGKAGMAASALQGIAGKGALVGGIAVGIGAAGLKLNQMAADAQTLRIQLDAVFGSGTDVYDLLQKFAAQTPFRMDETAQAARSLGLAGIQLKDIPAALEDLGTAAAVSGANLSDVSRVFAQMLGKGQIYAEEMQQLAEAGVPAWTTLAHALGVTEKQARSMAQSGELGRASIEKFIAQFGKDYPTALQDQAESFNGQVSTLTDNLNILGQTIGNSFIGPMTDAVQDMNTSIAAIQSLIGWVNELKDTLDVNVAGFSFFGAFKDAALKMIPGVQSIEFAHQALDAYRSSQDDATDSADKATGAFSNLVGLPGQIAGDIAGLTSNTDAFQSTVDDLNQQLDELISNFSVLRDGVQDVPAAMVAASSAAKTMAASLKDANGNLSPQVRVDILNAVEAYGDLAAAQVKNGESADKAAAAYERNTRQLAGGNKEVEKFIRQSDVPIKPRLVELQAKVTDADKAQQQLDDLAKARPAAIKALGQNIEDTARDLNLLAGPRDATINAHANTAQAEADLARLTADQIVNVYANLVGALGGGGGGSSGGGRSVAPSLLGAPVPMSTSVIQPTSASLVISAPTPAQPTPVVTLAPRQTPVKVYLDGAEIADQLELRSQRLARTQSVRRNP